MIFNSTIDAQSPRSRPRSFDFEIEISALPLSKSDKFDPVIFDAHIPSVTNMSFLSNFDLVNFRGVTIFGNYDVPISRIPAVITAHLATWIRCAVIFGRASFRV